MDSQRSLPQQRLRLPGPAGELEALLRPCAEAEPMQAAVLCHPHPLHGGTMMNKILYRLAKRLALEAGLPVLRFNFRGVGSSEGQHDEGRGEVDDAAAALNWMQARYPHAELAMVGYSFGAWVGLRAGARHERVRSLIALGLPLGLGWNLEFLRESSKRRLVVQGSDDALGSRGAVEAFADGFHGPLQLRFVDGADHLFTGLEDEAVDAVVQYLRKP